jgi:hypothetical protein
MNGYTRLIIILTLLATILALLAHLAGCIPQRHALSTMLTRGCPYGSFRP